MGVENKLQMKDGWPWQTNCLKSVFVGRTVPKLSIIIPSFNQGAFLEETLLSILNQGYPDLELIIIDGGSTDSTIEVIQKYQASISYWVSEADNGQSHAINKGLRIASGDWLAWMNSDDCYLEGALSYVFGSLPFDHYDFMFGNCTIGENVSTSIPQMHSQKGRRTLFDILKFFNNVRHIIPSQSVFIRKSIVDRVGELNENLHFCMDLDWFCRIFLISERRLFYAKIICFFRIIDGTKTNTKGNNIPGEAVGILFTYLKYVSPQKRKYLLDLLYLHRILFYLDKGILQGSFGLFLRVFLKVPFKAIKDRRFLGRIKRLLHY